MDGEPRNGGSRGVGDATWGGSRRRAGSKPGIRLSGLKMARARRGVTMDELGRRAGIHRNTVNDLENLNRGARLTTALRLAEALGVDLEELTGEGRSISV